MRYRLCVLFCVASGFASAESTQDYFSKAFKRAVPSPFFAKEMPDIEPFDFSVDANKLQFFNGDPGRLRILSNQARLMQPSQCAIPLLEYAPPKDRKFTIRNVPTGPVAQSDPLALPAIPVCRP